MKRPLYIDSKILSGGFSWAPQDCARLQRGAVPIPYKSNEEKSRVMKTGERWRRQHFLPALDEFYARHAPPASAAARSGDFRATLVLAEDKAAFQDVRDRPTMTREPAIRTLDHVTVGEPVHAFVLFSGCVPDAAGR